MTRSLLIALLLCLPLGCATLPQSVPQSDAPVMLRSSLDGGCELAWDAPVTNTDGSAYTDAAGFLLAWGLGTNEYHEQTIPVEGAGVTNYLVFPPASVVWYAVAAVNTRGLQSDWSDRLTLTNTVPGRPLHLILIVR